MKFAVGDKVVLVNKTLGGTGFMWEYSLFIRGWNKLAEKDKHGIITDCQEQDNVVEVRFPKLNKTLNLFLDEIILAEGNIEAKRKKLLKNKDSWMRYGGWMKCLGLKQTRE